VASQPVSLDYDAARVGVKRRSSAGASWVRRVNGQRTADRLDVGHIELDGIHAQVAADMYVTGAAGLD
jgi:predicted aspartyl protease